MVAPLIGMLVANVAGKALSGSGEGKEGGLSKLIDPLGLLASKDKAEKKEENPIEQLLGMVTGGGGGGLSLLG